LAPEPLTRLPALQHRGPEAYGFRGQRWTRKRVAEVIMSTGNKLTMPFTLVGSEADLVVHESQTVHFLI
jgi:hypothetical protein